MKELHVGCITRLCDDCRELAIAQVEASRQRDALAKYAVHSFPECPLSQSESLFYNVGPCACELDALLASLPAAQPHDTLLSGCQHDDGICTAEEARAAEPDGQENCEHVIGKVRYYRCNACLELFIDDEPDGLREALEKIRRTRRATWTRERDAIDDIARRALGVADRQETSK